MEHLSQDLAESLLKQELIENVWQEFVTFCRKQFDISSMFYGTNTSKRASIEHGLIQSAWIKTNHPKEYFEGHPDYIENDIDNTRCILEKTPSLWHVKDFTSMSEKEKNAHDFAVSLGLEVGVTVPIHSPQNPNGWSGIGLAFKGKKGKELEQYWSAYSQKIIEMCCIFDDVLRQKFVYDMYGLSERQTYVLEQISIGKSSKEIAHEIQRTLEVVNRDLVQIRLALKTATNAHSVSKAKDLKLIGA